MKIEHLAIWTQDLETLKQFYVKYFHAQPGELYHNKTKNFRSYFLTFSEGSRLELMEIPGMEMLLEGEHKQFLGLAHFAISVGSKEKVNELTDQLRQDGFKIMGEPRTTGDGYYESVVLDPEGNRIEITV